MPPGERSKLSKVWHYFYSNLNFFRVHVLYFTFTPIVFACIIFAANGAYKIEFVDAIFLSYSAITSTGLATINISSATPFQQFLIMSQMILGGLVTVSWVMVYIRRRFFLMKFEHLVILSRSRTTATSNAETTALKTRFPSIFARARTATRAPPSAPLTGRGKKSKGPLSLAMIKRLSSVPQRVDPSGRVVNSNEPEKTLTKLEEEKPAIPPILVSPQDGPGNSNGFDRSYHNDSGSLEGQNFEPDSERTSIQSERRIPRSQTIDIREPNMDRFPRNQTIDIREPNMDRFPRSQTVDFREPRRVGERMGSRVNTGERLGPRVNTMDARSQRTRQRGGSISSGMPMSMHRDRGFGGWPGPHEWVSNIIRKVFPKFHRHLSRSVSIALAEALPTALQGSPYLSFSAMVGRNSKFHGLTSEQLEELGGVEYRALTMLLWLVGGYFFLVHLSVWAAIAITVTVHNGYDYVFDSQQRYVSPVWFALFQAFAAFSNAGMSLVDTSMIPFNTAYAMIFFMIGAILGGNTAFPVFLRLMIWIISKVVPLGTRTHETLRFLLDHPRRCFLYMFPSPQTWLLTLVLVILNSTDWVAFGLLDIGNPYVETIPIGNRVSDGLFQSISVRTAGFAIVSLGLLSPAVKLLYMIMMYISAYPIAMSVRSTNVYEERSMGVYDDENSDDDEAPTGEWRSYLAWHVRKQLAFDIWWIFLAMLVICVTERSKILDPSNPAVDIFPIMFEVVSAYGTNGMSLGVSNDNFSLSGGFTPLSKIVICLVMLRGRHRGLPVAIDRAVVLPWEFEQKRKKEDDPIDTDAPTELVESSELHHGEEENNGDEDGVSRSQTDLSPTTNEETNGSSAETK